MGDYIREVNVEWTGVENSFWGYNAAGTRLQLGKMQDDPGVSPMELVLLGLAGCTGMTVASILRKMQQPLEDIRVKVTGWSTETNPEVSLRIYNEINVEYTIKGSPIDAQKVEIAIRKADEKYCPVSKMLSAAARIHYFFQILPDEDMIPVKMS